MASARRRSACIYVLAGTNGAGKSSILGAMLAEKGVAYFNPDVATERIREANPGISLEDANSAAWHQGKTQLERAILKNRNLVFETTLGGRTITALLEHALSEGTEVRVWYVGLSSPELHLRRVRSRAAHGGHDIPERKIRERYVQSILNLVQLLPRLTELRVYDNSEEGDPKKGVPPKPKLIIHCKKGKITACCDLTQVPDWAKAIVTVALRSAK